MSSITDQPKKHSEEDLLGTEKYTNGLIEFINASSTPITLGIQGEWGTGKTSLLNTLKENLCDMEGSNNYSIWLNTWEYSLLTKDHEILFNILLELIKQITHLSNNKTTLSKSLLETAIEIVAESKGHVGTVVKHVTKKKDNRNKTIPELRKILQEIIKNILFTDKKKSIIFFIDDLDRLNPTTAVNILELLKNLFNLDQCIFILAIDYDIVVKGLEPKFGKMTVENENKFRAFFHKIIQLPFSLPVANYNISPILISSAIFT